MDKLSNHHASRNTAVHFRIDESAHANVEAQEVTTFQCIVSPNKEQGNEAQGPNKTSCWGWRFPAAAGSTIAPTFAVCAKMLAAILSPSAAMTPGLSFCFHMFHSAMSQCLPPVHRANFALSTFNPVQINLATTFFLGSYSFSTQGSVGKSMCAHPGAHKLVRVVQIVEGCPFWYLL